VTSCWHTTGSVLHRVALRGDRAFGYIWAPLQGQIFSKSHVRGYGRLGDVLLDHTTCT
jgi:hypothetical protein